MKVLIDTCIWSQVLRHKNPNKELSKKLQDLINDARISIIGPIRQELLSGISNIKQFNHLKELLSAFEDIPLETHHFVTAAEFANICRKQGVQGSTIDFLICSVAHLENLAIFTSDNDFENYKKCLSIKLMK
ncbi:MAG: PIN domain-containing protein [Candidatus Omnitrophota bacterium]